MVKNTIKFKYDIKFSCGAQYTSRLEGMLKDMAFGNELNTEYHTWLKQSVSLSKTLDANVKSFELYVVLKINN